MHDHEHLDRYQAHRQVGLLLADTKAGLPWGCVATFYAAYHAVKWALRRDERFEDMATLKAINQNLIPDDRFADWHKARKGSARFGVTDLVGLMYPDASRSYESLHQASIEVRYNQGRLNLLPSPERLESHLDCVYRVAVQAIMGTSTEGLRTLDADR